MLKNDLKQILDDIKSIYLTSTKVVSDNIITVSLLTLVYFSFFLIDPLIRNLFGELHNDFFDWLFNTFHYYGKPPITLFTILILYLGGILIKRENVRKAGLMFFESFAYSGILVTLIKSLFGRWRPYTGHGNFAYVFFTFGPNEHLSLPSGDVAIAFAFSTIAAGFMKNKLWKIFWFGIATITAFGRIYHDQHWFTDAVMGAFIATAISSQIVKENLKRISSK